MLIPLRSMLLLKRLKHRQKLPCKRLETIWLSMNRRSWVLKMPSSTRILTKLVRTAEPLDSLGAWTLKSALKTHVELATPEKLMLESHLIYLTVTTDLLPSLRMALRSLTQLSDP